MTENIPKLLVVDDENDILEVAKSYFKKRGVEVFVADNGNEALRIIGDESPNLVLLDYNLPDMSGIEVLKKVREELKSDIKIIMLTGMDEDMVTKETESFGVLSCIHKPLVLEDLEKIVLAELNT